MPKKKKKKKKKFNYDAYMDIYLYLNTATTPKT